MSIIENVKEIAGLIKKAGDIELYRKLVELEGDIIELTRHNRDLEEKCRHLEDQLAFKSKLTFKSPFYFAEGDDTPYCPKCWEVSKIAIHLRRAFPARILVCENCKSQHLIGS